MLRCSNCKHQFLDAEFSEDQLSTIYSTYYPRSNFNLDNYKLHTEGSGVAAWLEGEMSAPFRWVPSKVRILDIGCGFGESLGYHQVRGCDVHGVEVDKNIQRVAEKFGYNVKVGLFDPGSYEKDYFDYVTMSQVIEHVTDPVQTLRGVYRILKPGGVAILSTPNVNGWGRLLFGKYWINWHAPYHLHYFSYRSMSLVVKQSGLIVDKALTITPSAWLLYQWSHLAMYPKNGSPSAFWSSRASKTFFQKMSIKVFTLLHHMKLNHLVTRFFDALRFGDSYVYFIRKPY